MTIKEVDRIRKIEDRPITLDGEIKMHCLMWKNDYQFKNLNKFVQESILATLDALSIAGSLKSQELILSPSDDKKTIETRKFISIYKQKYLELTDFTCEEKFTGATFVIIGNVIQKFLENMSGAEEYLNWLFDDYFREPGNKNLLPPNLKLVLSNFVINKYLFIMKDTLLVRKRDTSNSRQRLALMKIAVEILELTQDEELGGLLIKFGQNKISYAKAEKFMKDFVERNKLDSFNEKINVISKDSSQNSSVSV